MYCLCRQRSVSTYSIVGSGSRVVPISVNHAGQCNCGPSLPDRFVRDVVETRVAAYGWLFVVVTDAPNKLPDFAVQ